MDILRLLEASSTLLEALETAVDKEEEAKILEEHLQAIDSLPHVLLPEFKPDYRWINTSRPLSKRDLIGKVVVLDFFTYCCLNCLNLLPTLQNIEEKFSVQDGLVMVGVHSAKFDNERVLENVRNAVQRHDIRHPVINDFQGCMWNELDIQCWPTLIILGPSNQILFELMGESCKGKLECIVHTTLKYFMSKNTISTHKLPIISNINDCGERLSFPGKVSVNDDAKLIAISDTGNNRLLITDFHGHVLHVVGGLNGGYADGHFENSLFRNPQGICWTSIDVLFVADTGNHVIREVNLQRKQVSTIAGTGIQGDDKIGGLRGTEQVLNSPWDLCSGPSADGNKDCVLYIAMAGLHQIWALFLRDGIWLKHRDISEGTCFAVAGSGNEENRNNLYPLRASFAQPSGICLAAVSEHPSLIVADSESSTLRIVSLRDGSVKNLAGGDKDPKNLFAFGDIDGVGTNVKLQHPLGVVWQADHDRLFVCDSFNHKIKILDMNDHKCFHYAGAKKILTQLDEKATFDEPGGIDVCRSLKELYVADTNNHAVKVIDLMNHSIRELDLFWSISSESSSMTVVDGNMPIKSTTSRHYVKKLPVISLCAEQTLKLKLNFQLKAGYHLTENAPHSWKLHLNDAATILETNANQCCGTFKTLTEQPVIEVKVTRSRADQNVQYMIKIESTIYFCGASGMCYMKVILFEVPFYVHDERLDSCFVELNYILPADNE